jgi:hypothetical protein
MSVVRGRPEVAFRAVRAVFDPERSSAAVFGNEVDIDQHLMKCIVGTVKMMLVVSSLEISCSKG